ncbi:MAG TPA: hypothetical protein VFM54_12750 [Micromonosporaceae bacterium]|nr:hypothetical protein [Micromonosporaceae bacterium]
MEWLFLGLFVLFVAGAGLLLARVSRARTQRALADARADALRWYERLGGQVMNLYGDDPAVRQALVDASERYNAAGSQLEAARTERQYELARETALEGLHYVRAARTALGLDPGPELPLLAGQRAAGAITKEREVELQGHVYKASPHPGGGTPYYYPGGRIHGRPVPSGWYSEPWWKTALVAGAWGIGSLLVFNALFSPAWGDPGYDAGFHDGVEHGDQGGDGGDYGGDAGGDYGGGDYSAGDFGGGDFGGGDFGGGDFGGGDFG